MINDLINQIQELRNQVSDLYSFNDIKFPPFKLLFIKASYSMLLNNFHLSYVP